MGMKTDLFQSFGHCRVFQICWHIECSTFTASSFKIWNSWTGIPSPPLALFVVMLSKAHLTSHSRMCEPQQSISHRKRGCWPHGRSTRRTGSTKHDRGPMDKCHNWGVREEYTSKRFEQISVMHLNVSRLQSWKGRKGNLWSRPALSFYSLLVMMLRHQGNMKF